MKSGTEAAAQDQWGTSLLTGAPDMVSIASGCQKECSRNHATIAPL